MRFSSVAAYIFEDYSDLLLYDDFLVFVKGYMSKLIISLI